MSSESRERSSELRFGLRTLLLLVTVFCVVAGLFWFISLVLLLLVGVLVVQASFFLLVQAAVNKFAGDPESDSRIEVDNRRG